MRGESLQVLRSRGLAHGRRCARDPSEAEAQRARPAQIRQVAAVPERADGVVYV
jgi:hypothetical protein